MTTTFSVVGLGKIGASMAAAIASRGFNVIGVDINQSTVDLVNSGRAPVQETKLSELIAENRQRLKATTSHREVILGSDLTFVIVPTPTDERGAFSFECAARAFQEIGRALADKPTYHNVVLTSTVLPGATRYGLLPILERESGKRCGRDFGICYSPAFVALGSVIRDFLNPDLTLIGEFDERSGSQLEACYSKIMTNSPPCMRMSLENAELTKIAMNTYVTTKITFANVLADLCERIPGGDIDVVTNALGCDSRIGHKYLKGALGYGGPCFPRDNRALSFIARALGGKVDLAETTEHANRMMPEKIVEDLQPFLRTGMTVAVLGLAYKPLSHVIDESQGIHLAKALSKAGMRVVAYDPLAGEMARHELKDQAVVLNSPGECLAQADVVLITTPDPVFKALDPKDFNTGKTVTVLDCWRILDRTLSGQPYIRYIPIGRGRDDSNAAKRLAELWSSTLSMGTL